MTIQLKPAALAALTFVAALLFQLVGQNADVTAQQFAVQPPSSVLSPNPPVDPDKRVLVLRSGRVMTGRVRSVSTGWLVSTKNGHAIIPFHQVHFDADDLNEAYLRIRLQSGKPTVGSHLRLAEWCLSQNLLAEATRELRDALQKDPTNETARLMLNRVENEIKRQTPESPEEKTARAIVHVAAESSPTSDDEVRSLSGLSSSTAQEFVAQIQPLLLNKCGNARCHGPAAENEFRLTRTRSGASNSRVVSEKNLAAVLKYIGPDKTGHSQLLSIVRGSHAGRTILNGRYGSEQHARLTSWVAKAAQQLSSDLTSTQVTAFSEPSRLPTAPMSMSPTAVRQLPEFRPPAKPPRPISDPETAIDTVPGSTTQDSEAPLSNFQRVLQQARETVQKKDAFDPEEFNQRFAGTRSQ